MGSVSRDVAAIATKIDGHFSAGPDRFVRPVSHINGSRISFRQLATFAWPEKTEAHLAHLTGCDPRTCRRWLADDNEPPAEVLGFVLGEIMRRYSQRR